MKYYAFLLALMMAVGPSVALADHSSEEATESHDEAAHSHVEVTAAPIPAHCEFTMNLGVGSRGDEVTCLQDLLMKSGHLTTIDAPTGYFGEMTKAAVQMWQSAQGIEGTGYWGPLSREAAGGHEEEEHAHTMIDVSTWEEVPEVSITLHKDTMAGYNLEVATEHFRFAPEHVNTEATEGEGHAHVYVNGEKYARLYGSWMHLPGDLFVKGENEVRVTLNANTHQDLADGEVIIEAKEHVHVD